MLLQLKYSSQIKHSTAAALLPGDQPKVWLAEISRWRVSPASLECYVMPTSRQSVAPAGLFVIFVNTPPPNDLQNPYGVIGKRLFVPVNATIYPAVTPAELAQKLLYDRQVFHPVTGLVGFNQKEALNLGDLLTPMEKHPANWGKALPGIQPMATLRSIKVDQPSATDVLQQLTGLVDPKSLQEDAKGKKEGLSPLEDLFNRMGQSALDKAIQATRGLNDKLWEWSDSASTSSSGSHTTQEGLLGKLENWLLKKQQQLQEQRQSQVERLLKMFKDDPEEALRYSIPLQQRYAGRGTALPSSMLGRHGINFDLRGLRGGGAVDAWGMDGRYYNELRNKYQEMARKLLQEGKYRKAAYVYAHLLDDYNSAANALVQGKYYREAAALFVEHLNNKVAAAKCLEDGGLFQEAIELYKELEENEKVGDLYQKLEQPKPAIDYYEKAVQKALASSYLEAARLIADKLDQQDRARATLLQGWSDSRQAEQCLQRYFDLLVEAGPPEVDRELQQLYNKHTPDEKHDAFLNVLLYVYLKNERSSELVNAQNIAYEIIGGQIKNGNLGRLRELKQFAPEDKLLASDLSRFRQQAKKKLKKRPPVKDGPPSFEPVIIYQLDKQIRWIGAYLCHQQILALGIKNGALHLARGNWKGRFEYYSWDAHVVEDQQFRLLTPTSWASNVLIRTDTPYAFSVKDKTLPENKYFSSPIEVVNPFMLPEEPLAVIPENGKLVTVLLLVDQNIRLNKYKLDDGLTLVDSFDCDMSGVHPVRLMLSAWPLQAYYRHKHYYFVNLDSLYQVSEKGKVLRFPLQAMATHFLMAPPHSALRMVVATTGGCLMFRMTLGKLEQVGPFFAQEVEGIRQMTFVPNGGLIIVGAKKGYLYDIRNSWDKPKLLGSFLTKNKVVAALPFARRNRYALLSETGLMEVFEA